ncbi:MAG: phage minor structural protein [Clostridia bacterium]|jgi:phage minor structural protein|nr:phage minor structural protein [Clostridia bacterium]
MLYILDKSSEKLLTILDNASPSACPFYNDNYVEKLNGAYIFEFEVPADHADSTHITEENYVMFKDVLGEWQLFVIKDIEEAHADRHVKNVYCEHSFTELIDDIVETGAGGEKKSAQTWIDTILSGTRWTGTVDTDLNDLIILEDIQFKTVLEAINQIVTLVKCDLKFNITVIGNAITKREIKFTKRGCSLGKRLEYTKDLRSIKRTVNTDNLKTAILPLGKAEETTDTSKPKSRLTIASVNNNVLFVGDETARSNWGRTNADETKRHRVLTVIFDDIDEPNALKAQAQNYLNLYKSPRVTYEVEAIDFGALTKISHEKVVIGDTVAIKDKTFNPALSLYARVIELQKSLSDPQKMTLTLGNFKPSIIQTDLSKDIETLNDKIDRLPPQEAVVELGIIGGRNYALNTQFKESSRYWNIIGGNNSVVPVTNLAGFDRAFKMSSTGESSQYKIYQNIESPNQFKDQYVTLSAFIKYDNVIENTNSWEKLRLYVEWDYVDAQGQTYTVFDTGVGFSGSSLWQRVSHTMRITHPDAAIVTRLIVVIGLDNCTGEFTTTGVKLELGEYVTDYTDSRRDAYGSGWYEQVKDINNVDMNGSQGYVYLTETDGLYVYDKPSVGNPRSAVIIKGGKFAVAKWDEQLGKWKSNTFIKDGEIFADAITGGTMIADRVYGGNLILGKVSTISGEQRHGKLEIRDSDGQAVITLSADSTEYSEVKADTVYGKKYGLPPANLVGVTNPYMPNFDTTDQKIKIYVSMLGDDSNDGTATAPLRTIQEAINRLPKYIEHTVEIFVARGVYTGSVLVSGFNGSGNIKIIGETPPKGRYLYFRCEGGNNVNAGYHIVEVEAYDRAGNNIALNKARTTNATTGTGTLDVARINNGDKLATNMFDLGSGDKWACVDLGADVDVYGIKSINYFTGGRTYYKKRAYLVNGSSTNTYTFFDSRPSEIGKAYYVTDTPEIENGSYYDYRSVINGYMKLQSCNVDISLYHLRVENSMNSESPLFVINSKYVYAVDTTLVCLTPSPNAIPYGIYFSRSTGKVDYCETNNADIAGIISAYGSQVDAFNCRGNGSSMDYGIYAYSSSIISIFSTIPNGTVSNTFTNFGGQVVYSGTIPAGKAGIIFGNGTVAPVVKEYVETITSASSKSWQIDSNKWWTTDLDVFQSEWGTSGLRAGYWFFGDYFANLKAQGAKIKKVRAYIQRVNSSHGTSSAVTHYVRPHPHGWQPSGTPTIDTTRGHATIGLLRGAGAWVDLTNSLPQFDSGWAKGIMLYTSSRSDSDYSRCYSTARLEITYEK